MNRRKINILLVLGLVILYMFSMNTTFTETEETQAQLFSQITGWVENNFYHPDTSDELLPPQDFVDNFIMYNLKQSYPYAMRLYDKNGNIVAKSGSYIMLTNYKETPNSEEEWRFVNIEKHLSEDIKKQINNYSNSIKSFTALYELTYTKSGDEIIPVDITIGPADPDADGEKKLTFHLTDKKPSGKITEIEPHRMFIYIYGVGGNRVNDKIYRELNIDKPLTADKLHYIESVCNYDDFQSSSGGGASSGEFLECETFVKIGDEYYYATLNIMHNLKYDTLKTRFFGIGITISIIFLAAGLILIISINRMITKNQKINEAKDAFTSAAAHELKTPIAIIQNQCECIMENIAPEKNQQYIKSIYDESNRMNKLVLDLLQYNRVAMATKINKEYISLSEITAREIEKYSALIEARGISLKAFIKPDIKISANRELIALVIDNYISNAIKYGDGVEIKIILDDNKLSVFNSGDAIDSNIKNSLWEVFYRNDEARTRQDSNSSGLGLAICSKILKLHKYQYGCSDKANGVEFYFCF